MGGRKDGTRILADRADCRGFLYVRTTIRDNPENPPQIRVTMKSPQALRPAGRNITPKNLCECRGYFWRSITISFVYVSFFRSLSSASSADWSVSRTSCWLFPAPAPCMDRLLSRTSTVISFFVCDMACYFSHGSGGSDGSVNSLRVRASSHTRLRNSRTSAASASMPSPKSRWASSVCVA